MTWPGSWRTLKANTIPSSRLYLRLFANSWPQIFLTRKDLLVFERRIEGKAYLRARGGDWAGTRTCLPLFGPRAHSALEAEPGNRLTCNAIRHGNNTTLSGAPDGPPPGAGFRLATPWAGRLPWPSGPGRNAPKQTESFPSGMSSSQCVFSHAYRNLTTGPHGTTCNPG